MAFVLRRIAIHQGGISARIFSLLSVFGGGIFLATCLLDLLADSIATLSKGLAARTDFKFPIVELFIAIGFLFVLFTEQVFF